MTCSIENHAFHCQFMRSPICPKLLAQEYFATLLVSTGGSEIRQMLCVFFCGELAGSWAFWRFIMVHLCVHSKIWKSWWPADSQQCILSDWIRWGSQGWQPASHKWLGPCDPGWEKYLHYRHVQCPAPSSRLAIWDSTVHLCHWGSNKHACTVKFRAFTPWPISGCGSTSFQRLGRLVGRLVGVLGLLEIDDLPSGDLT